MSILQLPAEAALGAIFDNVIGRVAGHGKRARAEHPEWSGAVSWETRAVDTKRICGWACPGTNDHGTVFLCHGFTEHCMSGWVLGTAERIRHTHGLATVALDTRYHGKSDNRAPTFGAAEAWDLQAAMNWAESNGYPKPFILCGHSLGAMAVNRAAITDTRVSGAFLQSSPGWPWDAIGVTLQLGAMAGNLIPAAYDDGRILLDGDIRQHPATPAHAPLICYAMGDRDHYGIEKTKLAYRHWYQGQRGDFERWPGVNAEDLTWFITFAGADHIFGLHTHPHLGDLLDAFLNRVLNVATPLGPP